MPRRGICIPRPGWGSGRDDGVGVRLGLTGQGLDPAWCVKGLELRGLPIVVSSAWFGGSGVGIRNRTTEDEGSAIEGEPQTLNHEP